MQRSEQNGPVTDAGKKNTNPPSKFMSPGGGLHYDRELQGPFIITV